MGNLSKEQHNLFWNDGYLICRNVFSKEEILTYRSHVENISDFTPDMLSNEHLRSLITDDRILTIAKDLLGTVPVYIGDGVLKNNPVAGNWHKDNPGRYNRETLDWHIDYPVIRFAIYFQDHEHHSGGVSVRKNSQDSPTKNEGKAVYANTAIGDVVIWHGRATHRGSTSLLKGLRLPITNYKLDKHMPVFLKVPYDKNRFGLFFTYGSNSAALDHFVKYYATRKHAVDRAATTKYDRDWLNNLDQEKVIVRDTRDEVLSLPPEQVDKRHRDF